jgi:hypothetical protein
VEEIFQDTNKQMLETSYTLNTGQLLKIKVNKLHINTKPVNEKTIALVVLDISTTIVVINNHIIVIHVQIGKRTIDDVLLDGGYG